MIRATTRRPHRPTTRAARPVLIASVAGAGLLGGLVLLGAGMADAQDAPNPSLTLSFGSSLNIDDNKGLDPVSAGTTTNFDNSIGLNYLSETATSAFGLGLNGVLRFADESGTGRTTGFEDPAVRLSYSRSGANSQLSLGTSYRESDVSFFDPLGLIDTPDVPVDTGDLSTSGTGTRADSTFDLRLETGLEGPLGLSFGLNKRTRDFTDTTDPDYYDTDTTNMSLAATLRFSARTSTSLTLSRSEYDAEDPEQTFRRTDRVSLGVTHALAPDLSLTASLGQSQVDVDETVGLVTTRRSNDGLTANLGLTRELANGTVGMALNQNLSIDGTRTDLTVSRSMELPTGALDVTLGATQSPGGDETWIGSLGYSHALPRGSINASLNRSGGTNSADEDVTTTRARLGWSHDLTPATGIDVSIDYLAVDSTVPGDDRSRTRMRLAYTWDLPQDWQLSGGYTRTDSRREGSSSAESNLLFLSLQRSLTFAP
jgi:hypothetical protein